MKQKLNKKIDFSNEVKLLQNNNLRIFLLISGTISLLLGIIGIFLPILPTTPFLLLTAFCYAKSSVKFYNWLLNSPYLGKYIRDWRETRSIPRSTKILALTLLGLTTGSSILFFIPLLPIKIFVGIVAISVAFYLIKIPSK